MRISTVNVAILSSVMALATLALVPGQSLFAADASMVDEGKKVAFDRKKGNCLGCHEIAGGTLPGNIGPPLVAMKDRFPNKADLRANLEAARAVKEDLRAQIWDAQISNPNTIMPPFGKHQILTEKEVDLVVEFVYSL